MGKGSALSVHFLKVAVITINAFCGLLGALLFSLAIWMRVEDQVRDWVYEIGMYQYWNGLYIIMAAGLIIMIISVCGACGAVAGNQCLLCTNVSMTTLSFVFLMFGSTILLLFCIEPNLREGKVREQFDYVLSRNDIRAQEFLIWLYYRCAVLVTISIILELAGGIFLIVNGTQTSKLQPWLHDKFNRLIIDSNYDPRANRVLQVVQEKVGCCGSVNYQDYNRARLPISDYCRDAVSGNVYSDGCVKKFSQFMEKRSGWIAGIALFTAFLQIFLVVFTIMYWKSPDLRDAEPYEIRSVGEMDKKGKYQNVATNDR